MRSGAARRGLVALVLVAGLSALLVAPASVGTADAAAEPFVLGSGAASAQVTKARLFYAGYSLQVALGLAATTYENTQSRSLGAAYDLSSALGLVKVTVPEVSPASIDSNAGDAATTKDLHAGPVLGQIQLSAKRVPASTSEVHLADVDLTGLVRVEGGHSRSTSGIVDGKTRRAQASVTVGSVTLLGGVVSLDGLRWDAVQESGGSKRSDGSFSLARLSVAGVPIATDLHDLDPVLVAINVALAPLGFVLEGPQVLHRDNGAVEITPLRVGILNSPIGSQALAPAIAAIRPLLVPVYDALADVNDTLGLAALVADLGLGVVDGSGGIEIAVGGATARTDDAVFADPLSGLLPTAPGALAAGDVGGTAPLGEVAAPSTPAVGEGPSQILPTSSDGPTRCVLAASPRRQGSCRGTNPAGAFAVVAIVAAAIGTHEVRLRRKRAAAAA
jgi:hypothetical protein